MAVLLEPISSTAERPTGVGVGGIVERGKACNQQNQQDQIKSGEIQEGNQHLLHLFHFLRQ